MKEKNSFVREVAEKKYEYGFTTNVETDIIEKGTTNLCPSLTVMHKSIPKARCFATARLTRLA